MSTHTAVVTVALKAPLSTLQLPTIPPVDSEVLIRVEWTASTPLDLHQNDGGLLVTHPQVMGDSAAGTVISVGPAAKHLKPGDKVFGFAWREQKEKGQQEYVTAPEYLFGIIPKNVTPQEAVTLPNNFVTVFHSLTTDLDIQLPWPKPEDYVPERKDAVILVWGGASSVGQFAVQILKYYGYTHIFAAASKKHEAVLKGYGASAVFDYRETDVTSNILSAAEKVKPEGEEAPVSLVLDCIGSKEGSLKPIARVAKKGAVVAVLLPVIVRDSTEEVEPVYGMDVEAEAEWEEGVVVRGVRTHTYLQNEFFKDHLQSEIMPTMLEKGIVKPNKQRIVEGATLLERAQKALDALRRKEVSGERLVWRVSKVE